MAKILWAGKGDRKVQEIAKKNIEGEISFDEAEQLIQHYYDSKKKKVMYE